MASTRPGAKVKRNDPCPCGSGTKFKSCCMGKAGAAELAAPPPGAAAGYRELMAEAKANHQAGQLAKAADLYRQVLRRNPSEHVALAYMGQLMGQIGDTESGIRFLRQAIKIDGSRARYHANLAAQLFWTGDAEAALKAGQRALELDPTDALSHLTVGGCCERMNRLDEAAAALEKAIEIDETMTEAHIILAGIQRRRDDLSGARARIEALLARGVETIHLPRAYFELGLTCDRLGDYPAAYDAFEKGGAAKLRDPQAVAIDREAWRGRLGQYRRGLTEEAWSKLPVGWTPEPTGDGGVTPAFLLGFPRSGTTLTEQIMAAHGDIVSSDEKPYLKAVADAMEAMFQDTDDPVQMLRRLEHDQIMRLRAIYWEKVRQEVRAKLAGKVFIDKLPLNIAELALINVVFPEAKIIVALRDPRDCCLSAFMQDFTLNPAMINFLSLQRTTEVYAEVMDLWLHLRDRITLPYIEVRYEDTVSDLEAQARRILDLLDLPWDERVLSFHEKAGERFISTPSYAAVTEPVHRRAVARHRNYEAQITPLMGNLQRFIDEFGYA